MISQEGFGIVDRLQPIFIIAELFLARELATPNHNSESARQTCNPAHHSEFLRRREPSKSAKPRLESPTRLVWMNSRLVLPRFVMVESSQKDTMMLRIFCHTHPD